MIELLGHSCYAIITVGMFYIGRNCPVGWILRGVGNVGWIVLGVALDMTFIWTWCTVFLCLDALGWYRCAKLHQPQPKDDD